MHKKKSPYYLFVMDRMTELEGEQGQHIAGFRKAEALVGHEWRTLSKEEKEKYKERVAAESPRLPGSQPTPPPHPGRNEPSHDITESSTAEVRTRTFGDVWADTTRQYFSDEYLGFVPVPHLEIEQKMSELHLRQRAEIVDLHSKKDFDIRTFPIAVIHFNTLEERSDDFFPVEVGLVVFTLKDGFLENFSTLIDYRQHMRKEFLRYESDQIRKKMGLPEPGFSTAGQDLLSICNRIFRIATRHSKNSDEEGTEREIDETINFFSSSENLTRNALCLNWLLFKTDQLDNPKFKFRIIPLDSFLFNISQSRAHNRNPEQEIFRRTKSRGRREKKETISLGFIPPKENVAIPPEWELDSDPEAEPNRIYEFIMDEYLRKSILHILGLREEGATSFSSIGMEDALTLMEFETKFSLFYKRSVEGFHSDLQRAAIYGLIDSKGVAAELLKLDIFERRGETCCLYHFTRITGTNSCAYYHCLRMASIIMMSFCRRYSIMPIPHMHYPVVRTGPNAREIYKRRQMLKKWELFPQEKIGQEMFDQDPIANPDYVKVQVLGCWDGLDVW